MKSCSDISQLKVSDSNKIFSTLLVPMQWIGMHFTVRLSSTPLIMSRKKAHVAHNSIQCTKEVSPDLVVGDKNYAFEFESCMF